MHRHPLGRARRLAIVAAIVLVVSCLLPWYAVGGGDGLPLLQWSAFKGTGFLVFLAGLLTLALVALPYASAGRPVALDAWPAYVGFLLLALVGLVVWPIWPDSFLASAPTGLLPDRAPGFWLAIVGTLILARAAFEIHQEPTVR